MKASLRKSPTVRGCGNAPNEAHSVPRLKAYRGGSGADRSDPNQIRIGCESDMSDNRV